jgi:23S rRNA pseudouridine2605 synthase
MNNTVPLVKVLTESGAGSRRKMADAIRQNRVTVNGQLAENFMMPIDKSKDRVLLDGKPVKTFVEKPVVLIMNKPHGVLTTTDDENGRETVLDILPEKYKRLRLYPVGRLDKDSTGLLLITNDGELTNRITHPRFEHEKEYMVYIKGKLTVSDMQLLQRGVKLEDGITAPAKLKEIKHTPPYNYALIIHEGKKRQIRRMFANLGYPVISLKRIRIGNLLLGTLKSGEVRELTNREITALRGL